VSLEARIARLEAERDAARDAVDRAVAGTLWGAIAAQDWSAALTGWSRSRHVAWSLRRGDLPYDNVEDAAHAQRYAAQWRAILWPGGPPPAVSGAELLAEIKRQLEAILLPSETNPQMDDLSATPD
jgi:hypothetical protein